MKSLLLYCFGPVTWEELDITCAQETKVITAIKLRADATLYPMLSRALSTSVAALEEVSKIKTMKVLEFSPSNYVVEVKVGRQFAIL